MTRFIALLMGLATLGYFSATWAKPVTATVPPKDAQCNQSVCAKKCDTQGQKCLITCDDKATGNNCKANLNHVIPLGVLEVRPKRASP
jgi:hypothetical protein